MRKIFYYVLLITSLITVGVQYLVIQKQDKKLEELELLFDEVEKKFNELKLLQENIKEA